MAKYPYILKTGSLKKFLEKIPSVGVPEKVTHRFLYALDFKSVNDRPIIAVLKFIKFLDGSGSPTERYKKFRDKSISSGILASAIKEAYSDVFQIYPDADKKDQLALQNFFSTHTGLGERAAKSVVETFKALCSLADFKGEEYNAESITPAETERLDSTMPGKASSVHNLEVVLSEGRKVRLVIPQDITKEEIAKLKKVLDALE